MREALGAAVVGLLMVVGGLFARRQVASMALQTVGEVLVYGGALVFVIGSVFAFRNYAERRR